MAISSGNIFPPSIEAVVAGGISNAVNSPLNLKGSLTFSDLLAATHYDIYCVATSSKYNGVWTPYTTMIQQKMTASTKCCKHVVVRLMSSSIAPNSVALDIIRIHVEAPPSSTLQISIRLVKDTNEIITGSIIVPQVFDVTPVTWSDASVMSASLSSLGAAGMYHVVVSLSGPAKDEYTVEFQSGRDFFVVNELFEVPPPPEMISARWQTSGLKFTIYFDSNTDMGRLFSPHPCDALFSFDGAHEARCSWSDPSVCVVSLNGEKMLSIDGSIQLLPDVLRAECPENCKDGLNWTTAAPMTIVVSRSQSPVKPTCVISAPPTVGNCDSPDIDISSSTGSGGRPWKSANFSVTGSDMESSLSVESLLMTYNLSTGDLPLRIPSGMLKVGDFYDISVQLCNVMGKCCQTTHHMSKTQEKSPVVGISGSKRLTIKAKQPLSLQARAFVSMCNGSSVTTGLNYEWSVYKEDDIIESITSTSRDPSKFKLTAYTLSPSTVYRILVRVSHHSTTIASEASVLVSVEPTALVAAIAGGDERSVSIGQSWRLDATLSHYDGGRSAMDGVVFTWSCYQIAPVLTASCPLSFGNTSQSGKMVNVPPLANEAFIGSVLMVTLAIFDSFIQSSKTIKITLVDYYAPQVSITWESISSYWNPSDQLVLKGTIDSFTDSTAEWFIDDRAFPLSPMSANSPLVRTIPKGVTVFNFVLKGSVLEGRSTPYSFSLLCGESKASIQISVNEGPRKGIFRVNPTQGEEILTVFRFSASLWVDDDLPLSYTFGYTSPSNNSVPVIIKSNTPFGNSILPSGQYYLGQYSLKVYVTVTDSIGTPTSSSQVVEVRPSIFIDSNPLLEDIRSSFNNVRGNVEATRALLSTFAGIVSKNNCSMSPNCTLLNRQQCSYSENTCGYCLPSYFGIDSHHNSECLSLELVQSALDDHTSCTTDLDCNVLQYCGHAVNSTLTSTRACQWRSKSCTRTCGSGQCEFVNVDTDELLSDCSIEDSSCRAVCRCDTDSDFLGKFCDIPRAMLDERIALRTTLLQEISDLATTLDDISDDSIEYWLDIAGSLALDPLELSLTSANIMGDILLASMNKASDVGTAYVKLSSVLISLDAIFSVYNNHNSSSLTYGQSNRNVSSLLDILESYSSLIAGELQEGEFSVMDMQTNYRTTSHVASNELPTLSLPLSSLESLKGTIASSVSFSEGGGRVSMSSLALSFFQSSAAQNASSSESTLTSNPLRLSLTNTESEGSLIDFTITLRTAKRQNYEEYNHVDSFNTTCGKDEIANYTHTCLLPEGVEPVNITHQCVGVPESLYTPCPGAKLVPACKVLLAKGLEFDCVMVNFTNQNTWCQCRVAPTDLISGGRRLNEATRATIQISTSVEYIAGEFINTMATAGDLNSPKDLGKVYIVLLLYGCLWTTGLLSAFYCSIGARRAEKEEHISIGVKEIGRTANDSPDRVGAMQTEKIRSNLTAYVDTVFPAVYQSKWWMSQLLDELSKHHRYLLLCYTRNKETAGGDRKRLVMTIQLLSTQSMLMFVLAVLYDLEVNTRSYDT